MLVANREAEKQRSSGTWPMLHSAAPHRTTSDSRDDVVQLHRSIAREMDMLGSIYRACVEVKSHILKGNAGCPNRVERRQAGGKSLPEADPFRPLPCHQHSPLLYGLPDVEMRWSMGYLRQDESGWQYRRADWKRQLAEIGQMWGRAFHISVAAVRVERGQAGEADADAISRSERRSRALWPTHPPTASVKSGL